MLINDILLQTIDMSDVADQWLAEEYEKNPELLENQTDWSDVTDITNLIKDSNPVIGQSYVPVLLQFIPVSKKVIAGSPNRLLLLKNILQANGFTQYEFDDNGRSIKYPIDQHLGEVLRKTYIFDKLITADTIVSSFIPLHMEKWTLVDRREEI